MNYRICLCNADEYIDWTIHRKSSTDSDQRAFGYTETLGHDGSDSSHFGLTLHLMLANVAAAINGRKFPRSDAGFVLEDLKALSTEVDIWDLKYLKASTDWHEYYACLLNGS
ncbi:hypothetical protein Q3G72_003212 [Acer saccharum]|nr:hypothetical protein Q3G72_003212 [Acer saccharum]